MKFKIELEVEYNNFTIPDGDADLRSLIEFDCECAIYKVRNG